MRLGEEMENKLFIKREGKKVYDEAGKAITINAQKSKGPGNEFVKIEGMKNSNGQKWIALSKVKEGDNWFDCKKSNRKLSSAPEVLYELNADEEKEIAELQKQIDAIIEVAKARYVKKPNLNIKIAELTADEKAKHIEELEKYLNSLRG